MILAADYFLPVRKLQATDVRATRLDTQPVFNRVGADHLYLNIPGSRTDRRVAPRFSCDLEGIYTIAYHRHPKPQVFGRYGVSDHIAFRTGEIDIAVPHGLFDRIRPQINSPEFTSQRGGECRFTRRGETTENVKCRLSSFQRSP